MARMLDSAHLSHSVVVMSLTSGCKSYYEVLLAACGSRYIDGTSRLRLLWLKLWTV